MQRLLSVFLLCTLLAIVSLYIYYGMYLAKIAAVPVVTEQLPETVEVTDERTRRMQILSGLASQSSSSVGQEERLQTLESLATGSEQSTSTTKERLQLLEALTNPPVTDTNALPN